MRQPFLLRLSAILLAGWAPAAPDPSWAADEPAKAPPAPEATQKKPASPAKGDAPGDPFPGVSKADMDAPPKKADQPKSSDPFQSNLADMTETSVDGVTLDPAVVRKLIDRVQPAIVKITHLSRDGHILGTGSGFLISADGLVATNQHVIGTARPIKVELFDGSEFPVTAVHAWDRHLDLAILRLDLGDHDPLPHLDLAPPDSIEQGEPILGFGNPQGLKFSVVSGLVSAIRKLEGEMAVEGETPDFPLIQVAMPIEMGNSGGPIVDLDGRVLGIVTIKNVATPNLGFAVPAEHLRPLLDQPNTVPMTRWLTFGALDSTLWTTVMGARWTQRGGIIQAEGLGGGFGGRALCLSERPTPAGKAYEISVQVRLDDESGAAGLVFASDGGEKHYGFYPSDGQIRLTRFEGPDIYSWTILQQIPTDAYRRGEWNELRVRVTDEKITGFINGTQIVEMEESVLRGGKVGLCKFRNTVAEFRHFKAGERLGPAEIGRDALERLTREIDGFTTDGRRTDERLSTLAGASATSRQLLLDRAKALEAQAASLRDLTIELQLREVGDAVREELDKKEIDLFRAGLQIARLENADLDLDYYHGLFDRLVAEARPTIDKAGPADRDRVRSLAKFLFDEAGFHGSRSEYYHPGNSYLNEVLEYREGLPITLSIVFVELARRLGIDGVEGIPLPGQFLVGHRETEADPPLALIDVYDGGRFISRREAEQLSWSITGNFPGADAFEASPPREIVIRMLRNLIGIDMQERRPEDALPYIDLLLVVSPEEPQERFQRALLRVQTKNLDGAKTDLDWLLQHRPPGIDYDRLQQFRDQLELGPPPGSVEDAR
ncbi:MAG: tetratricopeptide repeat protein [Verrucomicrobiales bacterium]|nr:tetratricopeptide repeat protein [Verrucomicrobiales bacterium]